MGAPKVATEEFLKLIHGALERTEGDFKKAAILLHTNEQPMTAKRVKDLVRFNQSLRDRWSKSVEPSDPTEAVTIHRPTLPATTEDEPVGGITEDDRAMALALAKEDVSLREGLESIGIKGGALDLAIALQKFHSKHYVRAIDLIGGGVTKLSMDLLAQIKAIDDELADPELREREDQSRELMLREDRRELLEAYGKTFDRANKAALTQAMIKKMNSDDPRAKNGKKPGYLAIQAQPGSVLHVHNNQGEQ